MSAQTETGDQRVCKSVSLEDVAVAEFYLRARISSPLKSWFKPREIAEPCLFSTSAHAGQALASIADDVDGELDLERRPGSKGRAVYGVERRLDDDREERRFWIERGERVVDEEGSA